MVIGFGPLFVKLIFKAYCNIKYYICNIIFGTLYLKHYIHNIQIHNSKKKNVTRIFITT